jgi:hypothetical protein
VLFSTLEVIPTDGAGSTDLSKKNVLVVSFSPPGYVMIYPLVMTNSLPWKIHPFLIGKPW